MVTGVKNLAAESERLALSAERMMKVQERLEMEASIDTVSARECAERVPTLNQDDHRLCLD